MRIVATCFFLVLSFLGLWNFGATQAGDLELLQPLGGIIYDTFNYTALWSDTYPAAERTYSFTVFGREGRMTLFVRNESRACPNGCNFAHEFSVPRRYRHYLRTVGANFLLRRHGDNETFVISDEVSIHDPQPDAPGIYPPDAIALMPSGTTQLHWYHPAYFGALGIKDLVYTITVEKKGTGEVLFATKTLGDVTRVETQKPLLREVQLLFNITLTNPYGEAKKSTLEFSLPSDNTPLFVGLGVSIGVAIPVVAFAGLTVTLLLIFRRVRISRKDQFDTIVATLNTGQDEKSSLISNTL